MIRADQTQGGIDQTSLTDQVSHTRHFHPLSPGAAIGRQAVHVPSIDAITLASDHLLCPTKVSDSFLNVTGTCSASPLT